MMNTSRESTPVFLETAQIHLLPKYTSETVEVLTNPSESPNIGSSHVRNVLNHPRDDGVDGDQYSGYDGRVYDCDDLGRQWSWEP